MANIFDGLFSSLACCNDRASGQRGDRGEARTAMFIITCFSEDDKELTDLKVPGNTSWPEMSEMISQALGEPAMFVYDDGSGVDFPVRTDKEFLGFLAMVRSNKNVHGEYDIMLLPANDWARYDRQQKAALAASNLSGADLEKMYAVIGRLKEEGHISDQEQNRLFGMVASADKQIITAYRIFQASADLKKFGEQCKAAMRNAKA